MTLSLIFCYGIQPYEFVNQDMFLLTARVFMMTYLFPAMTIALMKQLGLIKDLQMSDRMDRIGPLIATMVFYLWTFINFRTLEDVSPIFKISLLGTTMALIIAFILTIFVKVSLHAMGVAGMLTLLVLVFFRFGDVHFTFSAFDFFKYARFVDFFIQQKEWSVSLSILFPIFIGIVGLVGSARLYLKAHIMDELIMGYVLGATCMFLANLFF